MTIPQKLDLLENSLNATVFERTKEIKTAILAVLAGKHHFQVGVPGIGKTYLVDTLITLIEGIQQHYFRRLMTRTSVPEELFGSLSMKALENDEFRRNTTRMLPEARFAFLDEIFKANSSILNALLTILNERLFDNGNGAPIHVPLITLFSGSNEIPKETELAALWDRITFRHEVKPIQEQGNFIRMLRARAVLDSGGGQLQPIIHVDELLQAQKEASQIEVPDVVFDQLNELRNNLRREGIEPTERRFADCIPIIRATAYRSGHDVADVDDMRYLRHVLWVDLKDQPIVDRLVLELANPLDKEAMELLDSINDIGRAIEELVKNPDDVHRRKESIVINGKLERASGELEALQEQAKNSGASSEILAEGKERLSGMVDRMLKELFKIDPSARKQ